MSERRKINIEKLQALLNEIDYQDFITMLAVLGREHPLGGIKQIQKLEGTQHAVIYIRCFDTKLRSNVVDLQERMAVEKRTLQQ